MSSERQRPDVVVIGSGFGGAVAAGRLAEAGFETLVLERGPWRDTVPVRSMGVEERVPFPRGRKLLTRLFRCIGSNRRKRAGWRFSKVGLYELFYGDGVNVVCSSGVGGGSHVYSAINVRPFVDAYWDGHAPGVSTAAMEAHYDAVLERMGSVTPMADHAIPNTARERFRDSDVLEPSPPPPDPRLGYLLAEDPANPRKITDAQGIERHEVDFSRGDDGFLGSPAGGKTTLDFVYLAPRLNRGLTVRALCEVDRVERCGDGQSPRYRVRFRDHRSGRDEHVEADHVIVAAGTLNTLRILFRSRDDGGLGGMPGLGRNFGTNGDVIGFWDYNEPGTNLSVGLPTAGGIQLKDDPDPPVLGGGGFPSVDSYPLPARLRERFKRATLVAGIGADAMDGRVTYERGRLEIRYDEANSPVFHKLRTTIREISRRTGRRIYQPHTPVTVHPMGGACLGANREQGVVDANGEVFDHPGLYVADAAALPRAPGGPPSMTIAAWSDHVTARFIARFEPARRG